jgi:hypothetical protein
MLMHTPVDRLHQGCQQLRAVADDLTKNPPLRIDYRERMRIERSLFVVVKEVCQKYLQYELHGLSEVHRRELRDWMEGNACSKSLQHFVREAFELRVFLLALSSANAYVQGDALSRASLTKRSVIRTLSRTLHSLAEKAIKEKDDQSSAPDR